MWLIEVVVALITSLGGRHQYPVEMSCPTVAQGRYQDYKATDLAAECSQAQSGENIVDDLDYAVAVLRLYS